MQHILVIGAGRSASSLIQFLLDNAKKESWTLTVADLSIELAQQKIAGHPAGRAVSFDIHDTDARRKHISSASIVVSMLPAFMHLAVAQDCLLLGKHLVTASYVSPEMKALHHEAKNKGLVFLNEMGLDPGIDHMSAMQIIDEIHRKGGQIRSFKSYCGGLVAPASNNNPWGYKFTWNPKNVVVAGQSGASYLEEGKKCQIAYHQVFANPLSIQLNENESFDGYPNRDSLTYQEAYGLQEVKTMIRGTLRERGYSRAWQILIALGLTDDLLQVALPAGSSFKTWVGDQLLALKREQPDLFDAGVEKKLDWLGIAGDAPLKKTTGTAAEILLHWLEPKWALQPNDQDRIVMIHLFEYELQGRRHTLQSQLDLIGKDTVHTAMSQTVGLPLGIGVRLIAREKVTQKGVLIPISPEIYEPSLKELSEMGIRFVEQHS